MTSLIFCLLILTISTLLVFTVSRSSHYEQQFLANEYWSSQGFYASDVALHYALTWLVDNTPAWNASNGQQSATLAIPPTIQQQATPVKFISQAQFISDPATPAYIEVNIKTIFSEDETIEFFNRVLIKREQFNGQFKVDRINGSWRDF